MKIKKSIVKDLTQEIKLSKKLFVCLSLLIIMSTSFFIAINEISISMDKSIKKYYDKINYMDIKITSTTGFTDSNINSFKNIKDVNGVMLSKTLDAKVNIKRNNYVVKINSISKNKSTKNNDYINRLILTSGKYPSTINEGLVEEKFLKDNNLSLGSLITLEPENNEWLKAKKIKITGTIKTEHNLHNNESAHLGNEKIDYHMYLNDNNLNMDFYKEIYITLNTQNKDNFKKEYSKYIKLKKDEILKVATEITNERYNYLITNLNDEISNLEVSLNNIYNLDVPQDYINEFLKNTSEKLSTTKQELNNIKNTKTDVITRNDISSFYEYKNEIIKVNSLGKIFSIFPILISILICLIAMIKKISLNKNEIILLKTLGYNKFYISIKYIIFTLLFSSLGCIIGGFVSRIIIYIISIIYKNTYDINLIVTGININHFIKTTLFISMFLIIFIMAYMILLLRKKSIKLTKVNNDIKFSIFKKLSITINKEILLTAAITCLSLSFSITSLLVNNSLSKNTNMFLIKVSNMFSIFALPLTFITIFIIFYINSENLLKLKTQNIYNFKNHFYITRKYNAGIAIGIIFSFIISSLLPYFDIFKTFTINFNIKSYLITWATSIIALIFTNLFTYNKIITNK